MSAPTTELEAVNVMLSGIGETPVNTLDGEPAADVGMAVSILNEISRELQSMGWSWNREDDYPLPVDAWTKEVPLPPTILRVFLPEGSPQRIVKRGRRLYDLARHSTTFDPAEWGNALRLSVHLLLPFDELPEPARRYVTLKALRVFQERVVGSQTLSAFQRDDEERALALLRDDDWSIARYNMLAGTQAPNDAGLYRPMHVIGGMNGGGYRERY